MVSSIRNIVLVLALIASVGLNIATVTVQSVAMAVSGVVGAVAGVSAVLPEFRTVTHKGEKKLLADAVRSTSERIARRTATGASRNLAATFREAIPTIGIGVIVGATALELKDACDTMKELHELDVALDPSKANDAEVTEVCGLKVPTAVEIWEKVKAIPDVVLDRPPELPEMPEWTMPEMPEIDWPSWD